MIVLLKCFNCMKKSLLMLGAAAIALASCTNEEVLNVSDSRTIGFNGTGIDNITRADITSSDFTHFYVYGGYNDTPIFNKTEVSYSGGNWTYNPTKYWAAGTWRFAGYEGGDGVTPAWSYADGLTLEVNSNASNQSDVVYAASSDITVDDAASYSTPVALTFTHLLSKIQFKFLKDAQSLGGVKVELSNFTVSGIMTNAKWEAGTQEAATSPVTGSYSDFSSAEEIVANTGLSTDAFYVIPQTVGSFAITADAVVTDDAGTQVHSGQITATVPNGEYAEWSAQNYYIYTATLKMENIIDPDDPDKQPKPIEFTGTKADDWNLPTKDDDVVLD